MPEIETSSARAKAKPVPGTTERRKVDGREILEWVETGYSNACELFGWDPNAWWPNEMRHQAQATLWSQCAFVEAAKSRCTGAELVAAFGMGEGKQAANKQLVLESYWNSDSRKGIRSSQRKEILVDFSVHNPLAASPIQFTGESEMFMRYGVGPDLRNDSNDYIWDFYKLLVVPSPTRFFIARVSSIGPESGATRCEELAQSLRSMVAKIGPAHLRPNDELGAFIYPAGKREYLASWIAWTDHNQNLRIEQASPWD